MKNHWPLLGSFGDRCAGVTATDGICGCCCWAWAQAGRGRAIPATRAGMASQRITWERMLFLLLELLVECHDERAGVDTVGGPVRDRQRDGAVAVVGAGVGVAADLSRVAAQRDLRGAVVGEIASGS